MKKHSVRQQDRPQTKLRVSSRRARVLQLFREGKSTRAASKILKQEGFGLGTSQPNVAKDLMALRLDFADRVPQEREAAYGELKALKAFIAGSDDLGTGETVDKLLAVHDRLSRLLGLDAPTKSVSAKVDLEVDPAKLVGYRRFVHETRYIAESDMEKLWAVCRQLNQLPTATDARLLTAGGDDEAD
jgi:hypothetical protein